MVWLGLHLGIGLGLRLCFVLGQLGLGCGECKGRPLARLRLIVPLALGFG